MVCGMKGEDMRRLKSENNDLVARYRVAPVVAVTEVARGLKTNQAAHENLRS